VIALLPTRGLAAGGAPALLETLRELGAPA
jgi:hypothetical protein